MRLIKFYTAWCVPCKRVTNILQEVDLTGVDFVEVDAEVEKELVEKYRITSVPVLIFEKDGVAVGRINGITTPEAIEEKLKASL